ncbi:sulfatase-like hydrolase/transferase [Coraliomargarita sp. W4R53]
MNNVIYMLADQLACQALRLYGEGWVETPNIDRLADRSTVVDTCLSTFPVCAPYRAMMMTGRYPQSNGHIVNHVCTRHDEIGVADAFAHAGYRTGYIGKWHLHRGSFPDSMACDWVPEGRSRLGWDYWRAYNQHMIYFDGPIHKGDWLIDPVEPHEAEAPHWKGYETEGLMEYVKEFLGQPSEKPFLLMVSPHQPHITQGKFAPDRFYKDLPESFDVPWDCSEETNANTQAMLPDYLAMVLAIDEMVGNMLSLIDGLGLSETTHFVFTSDHGTQLGMQDLPPWEKQYPYEASIRVPFLVSGPGVEAGVRLNTMMTPVDIMPTLCSLAGVPVPRSVEGMDLAPVLLGQKDAQAREHALLMNFSDAYGSLKEGRQWRGIRTHTHTYVRWFDGRRELYDLLADPYQAVNLVSEDSQRQLVEEMENLLQELLLERGDRFEPCRDLRHWFDSERRVVANAFGPLSHPETSPDWSLLQP